MNGGVAVGVAVIEPDVGSDAPAHPFTPDCLSIAWFVLSLHTMATVHNGAIKPSQPNLEKFFNI